MFILYHSYWYRLPDGRQASSRLDRWYVSDEHYSAVVSTTVAPPCSHSDHDAVYLRLGQVDSGTRRRRVGRKALQYPPPAYAADSVAAESRRLLLSVTELQQMDPAASAAKWDELKDGFRVEALRAIRASARKLRGSYRQRPRRLRKALAAERERVAMVTRHASLADRFELLTLDPASRQESLRDAIVTTQETYAAHKRIRKFERYIGSSSDATRAFFRHSSVKYGGRRSSRTISLPSAGGKSGADRLASDWRPVLQQTAPSALDRDRFFARLPERNPLSVSVELADFTASEVARAISGCARGKACGPDGIAND